MTTPSGASPQDECEMCGQTKPLKRHGGIGMLCKECRQEVSQTSWSP